MAFFSNTVENAGLPALEKQRSIYAIREMVNLARSDVAFALPQVRYLFLVPLWQRA